jgi:hypothetical protein
MALAKDAQNITKWDADSQNGEQLLRLEMVAQATWQSEKPHIPSPDMDLSANKMDLCQLLSQRFCRMETTTSTSAPKFQKEFSQL